MFRRALLVLTLAALPLSVVPTARAGSAASPPLGRVDKTSLDVFNHRLTVRGWAYDPDRPSSSIAVRVYVNGRYAGSLRADRPSPGFDRIRHVSGRHRFGLVRAWTRPAGIVAIRASSSGSATGPTVLLSQARIRHVMPPAGARIISVARRYVGRSPYVWGGASPRGFDCSGYSMYAYAKARVRKLPHNAEMQRHVRGMRKISRRTARPGDLVFYLRGNYAYHVAIYAGHGTQYAAVAPGMGVRHQHVASRGVQYRTVLH